ncbi:hypothetical protein BH09SUM1_BH09SUM1_01210 [soil metagenome]
MGKAMPYWRRAEFVGRTKPPKRPDGTLAVAPVCVDVAAGLVEDYQLEVTGTRKGRRLDLRFVPRPDSSAADRAWEHAAFCGRAGERQDRHVGHVETFPSPGKWADKPVMFGDTNDILAMYDVPARRRSLHDRYVVQRERASLPLYRAEMEALLASPSFLASCGYYYLLDSIAICSDLARGRGADAKKRHAKLTAKVLAKKRHLVERRVIKDHLVEEPLIAEVSSKGRSGRPVTARSAKVTRKFKRALAELDLDRWYLAIIITIAPPPNVDPIEFLRVADEFIRDFLLLSDGRGGIVEHPCEMFRATEPRHHPSAIKNLYDPKQLGLHDHTAVVAWNYMRPEERRKWGERVRVALLSHLTKKFGPLPYAEDGSRPCVHVQCIKDYDHFEVWMHGKEGAPPYILNDIKGRLDIPIGRNWTAHRNPPPELPEYPSRLDEVEEGIAVVDGERWAVKISGEAGLRFRDHFCQITGRRAPKLAARMEVYDADQEEIVYLLERVGADCRAIHEAWRYVPS